MKYFLHIPKTAGTTLLAYLSESIPPWRLLTVYDGITPVNAPYYRPRVNVETFFYGHFSFGFHTLWGDVAPRYVTVLRHPVERVASFYRYCASQPQHPMHDLIIKNRLSLDDFVAARLTGETNDLMVRLLTASYNPLRILSDDLCNSLTRLCTGHLVRRCPARRLSLAQRNLSLFSHVGTVERLQETADFLLRELGCALPSTQLGRDNTTDSSITDIGPSTRHLIESENEMDLELYSRFR
jgi:hypothetical protein